MTDVLDRLGVDCDVPPIVSVPLTLSAQTGRWRTAARLARRELRRRPWRTLLSVLLIAVPVGALVVADVAYRSDRLPPDAALRFGTADARLSVWSSGADARADVDAQLPAGTEWTWSPYAYVPIRSTANPDELVAATVVARDMNDPLNDGTVRNLSGRLPTADDEAVLDPDLAADLEVGIGGRLTLVRPDQTFSVVGIGEIGIDAGAPGMLAPGFDLTAIRPEVVTYELLLKHPSLAAEAAGATGFPPAAPAVPFPVIEIPEIDGTTGAPVGITVGLELRSSATPAPDPGTLFLGWLFGVLLMGVLGLVVAAAFAVSGRRQLVTIGQLSSTGADPVLLRRFLALQGTWTGLVGAAVGVAGGLGLVRVFAEPIRNDGRLAWHPADWLIVALTAVIVATVAAIVPTRSMAGMSVLSALGGRRPVPPVRRRQLPLGVALLGGGLAVIFVATVSAHNANNGGSDFTVAGIAVVLAGMAVLAGVCCLCPLVIDLVARAGSRRRGVPMLASRSLGRHRARAAALLAAIVAVGAAGTAIAAAGEQEVRNEIRDSITRWDPDVIMLRAEAFDDRTQLTELVDPDVVAPDSRSKIEAIVGPTRWVQASTVGTDLRSSPVYVADDALLALMGLSVTQRASLAKLDVFSLDPSSGDDAYAGYGTGWSGQNITLPEPEVVIIPDVAFNYYTPFVTPQYVSNAGLERQAPVLFGRADHDLTRTEVDDIYGINASDIESQVFVDLDRDASYLAIQTDCRCGSDEWVNWVRLGTIGGTLLLMALIVSLGMALWAAEGRDERDTLVAIGASPAVLARIAGAKAWVLAFVGMVLAIPLGFGTLRLAVAAARQPATFPWLFVVVAVLGLPVVIGAVAWASSAIGQRVRRVTAPSSFAD